MAGLDDALNKDPGDIIEGHNGESDQRIELRETRYVEDKAKGRRIMERVCSDNYGNWYLVYSAQMPDGELYDVADWVKPSALATYGGFNDALIDAYRQKAFMAFDKTAQDIQVAAAIAAGAQAQHGGRS